MNEDELHEALVFLMNKVLWSVSLMFILAIIIGITSWLEALVVWGSCEVLFYILKRLKPKGR